MDYELIIAETIDGYTGIIILLSLLLYVWNFPQQKIINILTSK